MIETFQMMRFCEKMTSLQSSLQFCFKGLKKMKKLWYKYPAKFFEEAVPIGNGRIGGMHYAGVYSDRISLNEDTLWSGFPQDKSAKDPYNGVCKAKELMREGKVAEAENVIFENTLGKWTESYQPAGNIIINLKRKHDFSNYHRELDLKNAVSESEFFVSGNKYIREVFCSAADNVMIYSFKTMAEEAELEIRLESPHPYRISQQTGTYIMRSIVPSYVAPIYYECDNPIRYDSFENNRALSYCVGIKPVLLNGRYAVENGLLNIVSTDFYLIIDVATNFAGFDVAPSDSKVDEVSVCLEHIKKGEELSLRELKQRHIDDYTSLFNRMDLHIEGEDFDFLATDERIAEYSKNNSDIGLVVLLYDFARYLTISCSREDSQASNLQGIWNENIRAPWCSNYTLNINTEMNYWHVEKSNLSECHMPLIKLVSEMAVKGKKTAQKYYNAGGWCSHHNTDIWRQTDPVGNEALNFPIQYGFWNMSGCWIACHIWNHFEYTGDIEFLKDNFNVLKGATEFLLDWMVEDRQGFLITPLSTSPENCYLLEDEKHALCEGCAMDIGIATELFECFIKASKKLGVIDDFTVSVIDALAKLKPYSIGKDGYILEWNSDLEEEDVHHRHISLLFGLYPGNSINEKSPDLKKAAEKVLKRRGKEGTGWAIGWRVCCWSRLGNGEEAKKLLDNMLRLTCETETDYNTGGGIYSNLLAAHPPFQIDANFAFAAGVNEMLLQISKDGKIIPLPALPKQWSKGGYIKGIKLPGNRTADIEWKNGDVVKFEIRNA